MPALGFIAAVTVHRAHVGCGSVPASDAPGRSDLRGDADGHPLPRVVGPVPSISQQAQTATGAVARLHDGERALRADDWRARGTASPAGPKRPTSCPATVSTPRPCSHCSPGMRPRSWPAPRAPRSAASATRVGCGTSPSPWAMHHRRRPCARHCASAPTIRARWCASTSAGRCGCRRRPSKLDAITSSWSLISLSGSTSRRTGRRAGAGPSSRSASRSPESSARARA